MPILRQNFSERDPVKVGIAALLGITLLGVVLFSASPVVRALSSISYTAVFGDAGGLQTGNDVRLNGARVGKVDNVRLDDDHVDVDFTVTHVGDWVWRPGRRSRPRPCWAPSSWGAAGGPG